MSRIPRARSSAKSRATQTAPCCICKQEHPEDQTNHRMREHDHQGHRCLGGDIPFAEHNRPPMGARVVGWIRSRDPMPCRTLVVSQARRDGVDEQILATLLAEGGSDVTVTQWMRRLIVLLQGVELRTECGVQRTARLRLVRERRAT